MTPAAASLTLLAVVTTALGLYVWRRGQAEAAALSFALLAISIAIWTVGIAFAHHGTLLTSVMTRIAFAAASFIPPSILLLFRTFPREQRFALDAATMSLLLTGSLFALSSFTPFLVHSASRSAGRLDVQYGLLHPLFAVYILACLGWSFCTLIHRYRDASGLSRLQFHYLLLGLVLPGVGVTVTNLIIPLFWRSSRFGQYGPLFGLIFLALTAHSLIRYRFMDVRLVLNRGVSVLLALTLALGSLAAVTLAFALLFGVTFASRIGFLPLLIGTSLGVALYPLTRSINRLLNAYTYRHQPDHQQFLRDASTTLARILDPDSLAAYIIPAILKVTKAEHTSLYVHSGEALRLALHRTYLHSAELRTPPQLLSVTSCLILHLHDYPELVVKDELLAQNASYLHPLLAELAPLGWSVIVPLLSEGRLLGLIALGPKLSRDPFFQEDLTLLTAVAGHAATAMTNATLYRQVTLFNAYLNNILATIDSGVIAVADDGSITLFNAAAERMTGLSPSKLSVPASFSSLPAALRDAIAPTLSDGRPRQQVETTLIDVDQHLIPLLYSTSALRDKQGSLVGAVLVFSDLTAIKHLETEKQHLERLASVATLASTVVHEIKNPLVAIRTCAELLPDRFTDADFREYFTRVVLPEIARIDHLATKLRWLESDTPTTAASVDLRETIEDTLALLRGHIEGKNIAVRRRFSASHSTVLGDAAQLKQLFLNLFLNALQSLDAPGELTVALTSSTSVTPPRLRVTVSDTGPGIPEDLLPRIFDAFVTHASHGLGLGLAICRKIADSHGATISASNNAHGPGATISVTFPIPLATGAWPLAPDELLSTLASTPGPTPGLT